MQQAKKIIENNDNKERLSDFDENLESIFNEIENKFFLLGASGLEDKLQDQVPEAINDFH